MNTQTQEEIHQQYSDLHDAVADAPKAKTALLALNTKQTEVLQTLRIELSRAKTGDPNVDLSGVEQGLMDLGYMNSVIGSLEGPRADHRQNPPLGINQPSWPKQAPTQGDLKQADLQSENSESDTYKAQEMNSEHTSEGTD